MSRKQRLRQETQEAARSQAAAPETQVQGLIGHLGSTLKRHIYAVLAGTGVLLAGGTALFLSLKDGTPEKERQEEVEKDVPLEVADRSLLDKGIIRIGIRSTPAEKQRIRGEIKRALSIALAKKEFADHYRRLDVVEQIVTPDLAQTARDFANLPLKGFERPNVDMGKLADEHGDAYSLVLKGLNDQKTVGRVEMFMALRSELTKPENFHRLLMTLIHECGHIEHQIQPEVLPRREEERRVYTKTIKYMERLGIALEQKGGEDAELGRKILRDLFIHRDRLKTWQR